MRHCKLKELTFGIQIGLFNKLSKEAKEENYVAGNAKIYGNAEIYDHAEVYEYAEIFDNAKVSEKACICSCAEIYGNAKIHGKSNISGDAKVYGNAAVFGAAEVCDDAEIYGNAEVYGEAQIYGSAKISNREDYIVFKNSWSSGRYFTYTRSNKMWQVGCFYGTGEELVKKAYEDSELSGKNYSLYVELVKNLEKNLENNK